MSSVIGEDEHMTSALVQKLTGVRDLKKILETTVKELGETFSADTCQIMLSNPLDPNVTAICEHRSQSELVDLPSVVIPLTLQGKSLGQLSLSRQAAMAADEINHIRLTLAELGDIIRHAQINDIVQRDTFRDTFLVEIGNVMAYSLGIGDALFMVVNILGKVLNTSRCIFICTDDSQAGWKCYEFWQQGQVQSCQEFCWPSTDSGIVAQTLLSPSPLMVFEGQSNSHQTPVQEELQFMGAKSLLGVALKSESAIHGCVILQQCDYRRAWTRGEIDMVQNVADKVAEALAKLPAEKRAREPIMQLHQRTVEVPAEGEGKESYQSVRRALKGALGQQAIPVAQKTSAPPPPKPLAPPVAPPAAAVVDTGSGAAQGLSAVLEGAKAATTPTIPSEPAPPAAGQWGNLDAIPTPGAAAPASQPAAAPWGNLDAIPTPGSNAEPVAPATAGQWGDLDAIGAPGAPGAPGAAPAAAGQWDNLQDIPTPGNGEQAGQWGNLDAIATPASGSAKAGLGGALFGKQRGQAPASPLLASLHKDKTQFEEPRPEFVEGPPVQIDEVAAQAKLQQILASSNPTSDYIFATPGLDVRMLGRIDGWISQVEQKDKYANGHARQVAEYACAIAQQAGLPPHEIDSIRLAALLHDVGKMGAAPEILQKPPESLSDSELLLMMKHTIDGGEVLESFAELKELAPIVRAHHEEYDGNGYPAGLKGEEIPVAARIIAVADGYHALVSPMRYRPGINPIEAQQTLTKGAGSQWDPRFVEALILALMQQKVPAAF